MCDVLKILIVEDQVDVQRVLDRLLTPIKTKFPDGEILFAENMAQAWQIIFQTPAPDVTVLDLNLPDSTLSKTIDSISLITERTPVIVMTGYPLSSEEVEKAKRNGASAVFQKSDLRFSPVAFICAIIKAITPFHKRMEVTEKKIRLCREFLEAHHHATT